MGTTELGGNVDFLSYIILAVLLAFIVTKLRGVLGKRTGEERPPRDTIVTRRERPADRPETSDGGDNVVTLPTSSASLEEPAIEDRMSRYAPKGSALAQGLMAIQLADRSFEPEGFLSGAKSAYEMIVTAFAAGDRNTLKPLLADDVMADFSAAIGAREEAGETMDFQYVGLVSAKMTEATLVDRIAEVTIKFISEVISVKKNAAGAVVEGDPSTVRQVIDVWTFARDTRSSDPNWELVGTAG